MGESRSKILVLYYSIYGHTFKMAKAVVEEVKEKLVVNRF